MLAVDEGSAKVDQGVQRSNDAGAVLVKIIEKSQNSTARVREIANATTSQRGDLERVEGAIHDVRRIVETIHRSTRDQSRANTEIANAIQNIRELGEDVRRSTNEQRQGSSLITNSVNSVADQLRQIAGATQSQNKSCETILSTSRSHQTATMLEMRSWTYRLTCRGHSRLLVPQDALYQDPISRSQFLQTLALLSPPRP